MSEKMNTPARRLLNLLTSLDSVHPQPDTVYHHFAQAFETTDIEELFELLKKSKELVNQYEKAIQILEEDIDLYLKPIPSLQNLFNLGQMNSTYSALRADVTLDLITAMQFADRVLSRKEYEKELSSDILDEITARINELESIILNSDLQPSLKQILNDQVILFRKALTDYRILGIDALNGALETSIAKVVRHHGALNQPEANEARQSLSKTWTAVLKGVSYVVKHKELIGNIISGLLGDGSSGN